MRAEPQGLGSSAVMAGTTTGKGCPAEARGHVPKTPWLGVGQTPGLQFRPVTDQLEVRKPSEPHQNVQTMSQLRSQAAPTASAL